MPAEQMAAVLRGATPWAVVQGDSTGVLKALPATCIDAVVCDPPAGIAFMGAAWDRDKGGRDAWIAWLAGIMAEARRCIKPGGHALVWALPRTSHWTGMALEQAGWQVRDVITHIQGQGFPKSRSLLKPASEHWILCRAPGPLQPLQIDAARVPTTTARPARLAAGRTGATYGAGLEGGYAAGVPPTTQGRWPANVLFSHVGGPDGCQPAGVRRVHNPGYRPNGCQDTGAFFGSQGRIQRGSRGHGDDEGCESVNAWTCHPQCPIRLLDEQAGPRMGAHGGGINRQSRARQSGFGLTAGTCVPDGGSAASRFFPTFPGPDPADAVPFRYVPKASRRERRLADGTPTGHPTQKPTALAAWLARLICPPGGVILDPFCGVASLGVGALSEGFRYIGVEQDAAYAHIARARLAWTTQQPQEAQHAG